MHILDLEKITWHKIYISHGKKLCKCRFFVFESGGLTKLQKKRVGGLKINSLPTYYLNDLNLRYKIIERGARAFAASDFRNWYSAATAEKTSVAAIEFKSLTIVLFSAYY